MTLTVSHLTPAEYAAWDAYVLHAPGGLPQHLSGWQAVMTATHHYETPYLMARVGDQIVGVLPMMMVRSLLVGHTAMTMPGGLCADDNTVAQALLAAGQSIAQAGNATRFQVQDSRIAWPGELTTRSHHVAWLLDLRPGLEALWQGLPGNVRRQVRLARKKGLRVEMDRSGSALTPFYETFCRFTHASGTPTFGRNFLENVIAAFPNRFNFAVVYQGEKPLGAYFQLELGETMIGVWGAALREYLPLRPVYLAYWEMIAYAVAQGFTCLDMGRSPADSNAAKFKGQWGGVAQPIYQQVADFRRAAAAESITTRLNGDDKFRLFRQVWPRLPRSVVQFLGPKLRRHVPFA